MNLALLVGDRHQGKTTTCRRLAGLARARGLGVGGILAPAVHEAGHCAAYDVVDLATGASARLATTAGPGVERVGRFHFLSEGLAFGRASLARALELPLGLVIVDEVGRLELAGGGWCSHLAQLAARPGHTLFAVRRNMVAQVIDRWGVSPRSLHDLAQGSDAVIDAVMSLVETQRA